MKTRIKTPRFILQTIDLKDRLNEANQSISRLESKVEHLDLNCYRLSTTVNNQRTELRELNARLDLSKELYKKRVNVLIDRLARYIGFLICSIILNFILIGLLFSV